MDFKILIVGLKDVGKASLINVWKTGEINNIGPFSTYLERQTNYGLVRVQLTQSHIYESGHDANVIM